jgi:hypothetical protein
MLFYFMSYDWCKGAKHDDPMVRVMIGLDRVRDRR